MRFTLSYRDVEDLLAERGLDISHETVRRWVLKFGPLFARELRRRRPRPTSLSHLDEMVVTGCAVGSAVASNFPSAARSGSRRGARGNLSVSMARRTVAVAAASSSSVRLIVGMEWIYSTDISPARSG
jgi:hypothetical protein